MMKKIILLLAIGLGACNLHVKDAYPLNEQLERGYGMFIHFGINTFNQVEWSDGSLPASSYNPTALDCDQWVSVAKEAGFRYVILITKHHDGFCLWDSKFTDYDVASSPVKTDVVGEVAKACKKYGLKLGLYYSLWDRHEPTFEDTPKYLDFMKNQLTELLTNYGEVCELWFDGGWAKKDAEWGLSEVYKYVKEMQPGCLVTVNHTIGQPGNVSAIQQPVDYKKGDPLRYFPVDFRIKDPDLARWDDPKYYAYNDSLYYLPFEHTLCLSDRWNWFQKKDPVPARSVDELEDLFYWCTSNNNILIINVPPGQDGKIRTNEKMRILELADRLGIRGGETPLPSGPENLSFNQPIVAGSQADGHPAELANDFSLETYWEAKDTSSFLEMTFAEPVSFDHISLFEKAELKDLGDFFSKERTYKVEEYELQIFQDGQWDTFYIGSNIGAAKIILLPVSLSTQKLRLKITRASGVPSICHIAVDELATKGLRKITEFNKD